MRHPTVHLNGTSKDSLLKGYREAYESLNKAQEAMGQCSPHGRDYYPQGDNAIHEAIQEHRAHMKNIAEAIKAIEAHVQHIFDTYPC